MNIYELIEQLEDEFDTSKSFLWSKKSLVDIKKCAELVSELKRALPDAITEASYLLAQRDKILEDAKKSAEKTLAEANYRAEQLVNESSLVVKAENEARALVQDAQNKAEHFSNNAKCNVDKMLKSIEDYLMENLMIVRNNREELAGGLKKKK